MKAYFTMFAAYNEWANRRLYDACAPMGDAARKAEAGAFFGSLHGTLGHLVIADQIWMRRFTGDGPAPAALADNPFEDFGELRSVRAALDARIIDYVAGLADGDTEGVISYTTLTTPEPVSQPLASALAHLFNHQTHHRGQCHHMLTAAGQDAPPLDLLYYQREN